MKFRQLIVSSIILVFALSAQAAFVAGMSPAQLRAEITAEQAAGSDIAAVIGNAAAADVNLNSLVAVLVTMPGINPGAAVSAAAGTSSISSRHSDDADNLFCQLQLIVG